MDYIQVIQKHFESRRNKNKSYSLRAYARDLNVSHTLLNRVLTGKGKLSVPSGAKIAKKLRLIDRDLSHFMDSVRIDLEQDAYLKALILKKKALHSDEVFQFQAQDLEGLKLTNLILILSVFDLPFYQKGVSEKKIQELTQLPKSELKTILDRLQHIGALTVGARKLYVRAFPRWELRSNVDASIFKQVHRDFMIKASQALDLYPPTLRFSASDLIVLAEDDLTAFHELCSEFLEKAHILSKGTGAADARIFTVCLQAFPVLDQSGSEVKND